MAITSTFFAHYRANNSTQTLAFARTSGNKKQAYLVVFYKNYFTASDV